MVKGIRRSIASLALIALALGAAPAPAAAAPEPGPSSPTRVTLWVPARGGYLAAWRQAVATAQQAAPHLQFDLQPMWDDYGARLTLALAEGQAPPLVVIPPDLGARLASRGWLQPVTDLVKPYPFHPAQLEPYTWEGEVYAVPGFLDLTVLFANQTLLAAAGVAPPEPDRPWNWQELLAAARSATAAHPDTWGFPVNGWPPLEAFVVQAGGSVPVARGAWGDTSSLEAAARYYRQFLDEGLSPAPPQSWAIPIDSLFRTGRAALFFGLFRHEGAPPVDDGGASAVAWTAAPAPVGPDGRGGAWAWAEGLAIPAGASPVARQAAGVLAAVLAQQGLLPPDGKADDAVRVAAQASLPYAFGVPAHPRYLEFSAAWWTEVVRPLLTTARRTLDIPHLLRQALPHLEQALQGG